MLLPALGRAREAARRSVCLSRLKQQYLGHAMYASDFNGLLVPWGYMGTGDEMYANLGSYSDPPGWSSTVKVGPGLLYPHYVNNYLMFYCPSNLQWLSTATPANWNPTPLTSPYFVAYGTGVQITYMHLAGRGLTTEVLVGWSDNKKGAWKRIDEKQRTIAADRLRGGFVYGAYQYDMNHPAQYWGGVILKPQGGNFMWTDGHVAWNVTSEFAAVSNQWVGEVWVNGQHVGIYAQK